jgi:Sap, sulfolipid-1-addressing protein
VRLQLLLLALYAACYPTLLAAVLILLSQPRRVRLLTAYLAGGLTISITLGLAIVFGLQGTGSVESSKSALSWQADLAVGGLALLAAVALATGTDQRVRERRRGRRPPQGEADKRDPWSQRILARGSIPIVFVAALAINIPGAAYLVALKDIVAGNHSDATNVVLVVGFNLIMFLLAEIPLIGLVRAPERTEELLVRTDSWLSSNGRRIATVMAAVLGALLIARGIAHST